MDARTTRRGIHEGPTKTIGFKHSPRSQVCRFWQQGKCIRNPCRFLHSQPQPTPSQPQPTQTQQQKRPNSSSDTQQLKRPNPSSSDEDQSANKNLSWTRNSTAALPKEELESSLVKMTKREQPDSISTVTKKEQQDSFVTIAKKEPDSIAAIAKKEQPNSILSIPKKAQKKLCQYWANDSCLHGDNCSDLHSWSTGSGFSFVTNLERHKKAVTGVALPTGSNKLFSGSNDGSMCVWDCKSGKCLNSGQLGSEIGCVISEAPWLFVGLQNGVMAWNLDTQTELHLSGPNGLVRSLAGVDGTLFGGVQDGSILAWEAKSGHPVVVATLKGHQLAVLCLAVGVGLLYSGSEDKTIRVWDTKTSKCLHVLNEHAGFVTSVVCCEAYLISGSLDNSIKIWGLNNGNLKVVRELEDESGVLALRGIHDEESNPILLCSRTDNTVRLYNLPSCAERGRILLKGAVNTIAIGRRGLFFTGDVTGQLGVWKLHGQPSEGSERS